MRASIPLLVVSAFLAGALVGRGMAQDSAAPRDVTGIGGVFFKVDDPARFSAWYREHLGIDAARPADNFVWRERDAPDNVGYTVWSPFPRDTGYFGSSEQPLMINYRVRDLDALLAKLRAAGVEQVKDVEEYPYGRFAWILDGEGNRVELWEPAQQTAE